MLRTKIPRKNYIKLFLILFFSLIVCTIIFIIYNNWNNNDLPILRNKVSEIEVNDVDNYISENETVLLYFGVVKDENSEKIEKEMLDMIDKDNVDFVYVNITNLKNKKSYFKSFNEKYSDGKMITNYPAFVYIENEKIVDIIQRDDRYLEIEDVENFIKINEIKGEENA